MEQIILKALNENLDLVFDFLDKQIDNMSEKIKISLQVAVEEIFVNVCNYAYTPNIGDLKILCEVKNDEDKKILVTFIDSGIPYNPLVRPEVDTTLSVEDRPIGGLGIHMVKKMMDDVKYQYRDGQNILTLIKNF